MNPHLKQAVMFLHVLDNRLAGHVEDDRRAADEGRDSGTRDGTAEAVALYTVAASMRRVLEVVRQEKEALTTFAPLVDIYTAGMMDDSRAGAA
jgi:hypothetical protein